MPISQPGSGPFGYSSPFDYFNLLVNDRIIDLMVEQTNLYANQEINRLQVTRSSRLKAWKETDHFEMRRFLGLLLHMGPNQSPKISSLWSQDPMYRNDFYKNVMSRNRFQLILRFWHFSDNASRSSDRLEKIRPLLDHFNNRMSEIYYPECKLSIDESMMLWRGRLCFRQYIPDKKHKYGIKLYELCESRGLIFQIRIHNSVRYENEHAQNMGQAAAIVQDLMESGDGYMNKGHIIHADNWYNSVALAQYCTENSTYICGTLRVNRKGNPIAVTKKKLSKGEMIWRHNNSLAVCKWKDKRDVLVISNMHCPEIIDVRNHKGQRKKKPNIIQSYNEGMSGIDHSDQMLSYHTSLRKSLRWYKKLGVHLIEMLLYNSFLLYIDGTTENQRRNGRYFSFLTFREEVVKTLVGNQSFIFNESQDNSTAQFHYLESLPPTNTKTNPTKRCMRCYALGIRREVRYFCPVCITQPSLCVDPCFRKHHEVRSETINRIWN